MIKRSFWMDSLDDELSPTEALCSSISADVAIIGGGFVGLWTALEIIEKSPNSRVVILEKDICGAGASGRNGGFVMSWWPKIDSLLGSCGQQEAIRLATISAQNIREIGEFCESHKIDAHFKQNGWLWTATTEAQMNAWESVMSRCEALGHSVFQRLSPEEIKGRTGSGSHLAGVFDPDTATVQPARLVRGLRRVALAKGIQIFENTKVVGFDRLRPVVISTENGSVVADSLVIANNVWAGAIPELSRAIVPVTSTIVVTEAIPDQLDSIGWQGGEAITDSQLMVNYYRTTQDGRIAFGKGTGVVGFGTRIDPRFDFDERDVAATEADFRRVYPALKNTRLEYCWSGPIDRTYDSLPIFGALPGAENIVFGVGWSGNGVGPSRIGGRVLSSMALGLKDEWSRCGLVNRKVKKFPPEPLRYLGGNFVRQAVVRKERTEAKGSAPAIWDVFLAGLAPVGLEDKSA